MMAANLFQVLQTLLVLLLAPLFAGYLQNARALLQNRRPAGILQPYRDLLRLFHKESIIAEGTSWLFRATPYLLFAAMWLAAGIVPILATALPLAPAADVIALVGLFALARVFQVLAAMDTGTAFGTLGARREMLVAAMAEPALLAALFTASLLSHSTSLSSIVDHLESLRFALHPSMVFAAAAFFMVLLAENARIPVDNPATHLELTMIHEAMILEYSGRHLALVEWAAQIKLLLYVGIGIALFLPWGIAPAGDLAALPAAAFWLALKLLAAGAVLAVIETLLAKLRLFRAPEFMATAFLLGVIGLLSYFMLGA
ncbi:respiratory chain complex I subunit 1 family protein [Acidithiobacillus sulfuriphilus]|uniref:NADH-quinone oxidoreductase subunit H n=2 Tax=Acidithiobacillus sulfuriphilus TaxID=1867749 RepID=A0ACD5HLG3_9PROT|nr:NADH-quinone oxidoreductase subunit H [Acidithiobacillus sulfuriphilus]